MHMEGDAALGAQEPAPAESPAPSVLDRLGDVARKLRGNRALTRLLSAYALSTLAEYGEWIVLLIYAYGRGGTAAAGAIALAQLLPSMLLAPVISARGARGGELALLRASLAFAAVSLSACAASILLGAPALITYLSAVGFSIGLGVSRPLHTVILPRVVTHPDELTAANAATNWCEGLATLVGPALVGVLIAVQSLGVACAAMAALTLLTPLLAGAHLLAPVDQDDVGGAAEDEGEEEDDGDVSAIGEVRAAARVIVSLPATRTLMSYRAGAAAVEGSIDLLIVVIALRLLKIGPGAIGFLTAAFGAGGLLGGLATVLLIGRKLATPLFAAALIAAAAVAALAGASTPAVAAILVAVVGAAVAVQSVAAQTLLQRSTPLDVVVCAFTLVEAMRDGGLAFGSVAVPLLVGLGGPDSAFAGIAVCGLLAVLLTARNVRRIDDEAVVPVVEMGLLRRSSIFAALPAAPLEGLAHEARYVELKAGEPIIREGEMGADYYLIVAGSVIVTKAGAEIRRLGAGRGFGEIALLNGVRRTASVTAVTDTTLLAVGRDAFLTALDARTSVRSAAMRVADKLLAHAR